jgi:Na+-translocating ferredoxin:NAD+ oxidoreductase RNF subunit RnfB
MTTVATALLAMGALTTALASLLVFAHRRLRVVEDPRLDAVEDMLPGTNCGACGFPGCRAFAEALVQGAAPPAKCSVSAPEAHARIAAALGVDVGRAERRVARLACAGGANVARNRARYTGLGTCAAAALVAGGGKGCFWGCLGLGDCAGACGFDAIHMDAHQLPVVDAAACTACGDCVTACPKDLFTLRPLRTELWVQCASRAAGDAALADCDVACDACGRCAKDGPALISIRDNLPVVDYAATQSRAPIERCPTGAIVWLDGGAAAVRGAAARKIIRHGPRPEAPT